MARTCKRKEGTICRGESSLTTQPRQRPILAEDLRQNAIEEERVCLKGPFADE